MKLYSKIILAFFLFSLVNGSIAQSGASLNKTGTTAAQFLKIGVGTRAIGMGGAFTTVESDVNSMYWNPAGLARIYSREATFNHIDWIFDVNYDYTSFAMNLPELGTVGVFVSVLSGGEMQVRTLEKPEGTGEIFNAGALAVGLSFARKLTENFVIGFNAKYIREYIWSESASSFAFDVGTLYTIPLLNEFRIGASISNFGSKMKMDGRDILLIKKVGAGEGNIINTDIQLDEFDLPLIFRIGVGVDVVKDENQRLTAAVDAIHPNDNSESVNTGFEYAWNEMFFARAGYKSLFEEKGEQGLTLGLGINYRIIESVKIMLDYAYQDFGRLKNVQYISLGVRF